MTILAIIAAAIGGLLYVWFHDWETPETLSWKVQEKRRDK